MNECRSALVTARWCRLLLAVANEACKSAPGGGAKRPELRQGMHERHTQHRWVCRCSCVKGAR